MPTPTEELIAKTTLASAAASYTFSSIPNNYTDLILVSSNVTCSGTYTLCARLNGDTGSNYSWTTLFGNGTSALSYRTTAETRGLCFGAYVNGMSATVPATSIAHIMNYSSTSIYKTSISRYSGTADGVESEVSLWRSTAAINSVEIRATTGNLLTGSTFSLYGVL